MSTSVYLGNLSWDLDEDALFDTISQIAEPTSVEIKRKRDGRSLGYAIAQFATPEDGQAVIESLHGQNLEGREVNCREDRGERARAPRQPRQPRQPREPREPREEASPAAPTNRVYIGNLSWDTDEDLLLDVFADYNVVTANVQRQHSGASKGWALAEFSTEDDAAAAIDAMNGAEIDGREAIVREDRPPQARQRQPRQPRARREPRVIEAGAPSTSVFVGNLSWDMDDASLADELGEYAVVDAVVQQRPDGKSRGYALVQFETVEEAQRAIDELNGAEFMGRNAVLKFDAKP